MRRLWIVSGCLLALLAIALIGGGIWIRGYLRSDAFRQLVERKTGDALKADVTIDPLSWSGSSVFSPELAATGNSNVEKLSANGIRARVNWRAIIDGVWKVDHIDVQRLDATLGRGSQAAPEPPSAVPSKRVGGGWLPTRFELDELRAQEMNLTLEGFGAIQRTTVAARPEGSGWVVQGSGGTLEIPDRQRINIGSCTLRIQKNVLYLTSADLRLGRNGSIQASGEIASGDFDVQVDWQGVDASDILEGVWKQRLTGALSGEAKSIGGGSRIPETSGNFLLADGMLSGLPVQSSIATFTGSPQFERIPIHEISGNFTHAAGSTDVTNFVLESRGLVRVEGTCRISADDAIDGDFQIGVTMQTLRWLPGSREKVFVDSRNGYQWTSVKVSGTTANPREDLSRRLLLAAGEAVIDSGLEVIENVPDKANDAIDKAVEILTPLIP